MSQLILSLFRYPKRSTDKDGLQELKNGLNLHKTPLFTSHSPLTPAYGRAQETEKLETFLQEVEDKCRIFKNYLVEMIVGEGKMTDLMDAEELLHCWKNLKCPIFIDLVCRFYAEIFKNLFSLKSEQGHCSIPNDG
ncbi:hypothetical protein RJT34_12447 [Clitoria ternatea]|uniref:OVATE domain-containing protein n=1 Tax=Clitoria ternatea TaxID=43366 RepID=A0AAN9PJC0_CLITE